MRVWVWRMSSLTSSCLYRMDEADLRDAGHGRTGPAQEHDGAQQPLDVEAGRACRSNDNGLAETKSGAVVRKIFGYEHIPHRHV